MQTYHNQGGIIRGAGQLVREYVGNLQDNTEALRSNFSGSSAPTDPAIGQKYFNVSNNVTYVYNGTAWIPDGDTTATHSEVVDARGQMNDLGTRLNVSMNPDGTLKDPVTANVDEWKTPPVDVTYVSENSFTVPDDMTPVFTAHRGLKLYDGTNTVFTTVKSSEYSAAYGVTTITTSDSVVSADIKTASYSIIQDSAPIGIADTYMVKRNTAYAVGDTVTVPGLPIGMYLECTTGGTTGATAPVISPPVTEGDTISDGTVIWTIRKTNSIFNTLQMGVFNKKETFTASGSFTAPVTGTYRITLCSGGGGGAGAGQTTDYNFPHTGGGGGSGCRYTWYEKLTAGTSYTFTIGAGGAGGNGGSSNQGGNGGYSEITVNGHTYRCSGGYGSDSFRGGYAGSLAVDGGSFIRPSGWVAEAGKCGIPMVSAGTYTGSTGGFGCAVSTIGDNSKPDTYGRGGVGGSGYKASSGTNTYFKGGAGGDGYITFEYCDI